MFSIFFKIFSTTVLAAIGFLSYRFPEQSVVLLIGIGLTVFAVVMRRRRRRALEEIDRTASA